MTDDPDSIENQKALDFFTGDSMTAVWRLASVSFRGVSSHIISASAFEYLYGVSECPRCYQETAPLRLNHRLSLRLFV